MSFFRQQFSMTPTEGVQYMRMSFITSVWGFGFLCFSDEQKEWGTFQHSGPRHGFRGGQPSLAPSSLPEGPQANGLAFEPQFLPLRDRDANDFTGSHGNNTGSVWLIPGTQ